MNDLITNILENSDAVAGVHLEKAPTGTQLVMTSSEGQGRMVFYTLFSGVTLAFVHVAAPRCQESDDNTDLHPLLLNYCVRGRSELLLDDGNYIYLQENDLCLSNQTAQKAYIFPTSCYEGLKLYLDETLLTGTGGDLLRTFGIDVSRIAARCLAKQQTVISEASGEMRETLRTLWQLREAPDLFRLQLHTLILLHLLLTAEPPVAKTCSFYTETQVLLAKRASDLLTADLRAKVPIHDIAQDLGVGETSLKNYFRGVYGQNMSTYLRRQRVERAAVLLSNTNLPIADISAQVGYSNQGKFAAVFRNHFGLTPLNYRRQSRLSKKCANSESNT